MNKQVADVLSLSIKTVETHRQHIMQKLALRHAADLMRFAIEWRVSARRRG
jgi:DNA-binding NarL/FixJ family response regulator